MPLVTWVERSEDDSGAAIGLVYAKVVFGSLWTFARGAAPRMTQELQGIRGEIPTMVNTVPDQWVPQVQEKLRAFGIVAPTPSSEPEPRKEEAALVARPRPDGSIAIDVGSGLLVAPSGHGGYAVTPAPAEKSVGST